MIASPLIGKNVLVVDDEVELCRAIIFDLNRRGCITYQAGSGIEALEIALNNKIEIVISDVRMPNGSGIDLLQNLRKIHPHIPVVLLVTGFADLTEPEAFKMGAKALLEKPIDRRKLIQLLEQQC